MPTKIEIVKQSLAQDNRIVVHRIIEYNHLPEDCCPWVQTFDIIVYPKKGLYTIRELQALMMSLVPNGLRTSCKDDFSEGSASFGFGRLYFDEVVGYKTSKHEIQLTDESLLHAKGFINGKYFTESSQDVSRRTWVSLFPDKTIAELVYPPEGFTVDGPAFAVSAYSISQEALRSIKEHRMKIKKITT